MIQTERSTEGMTSGYSESIRPFQLPATVMILGVMSNERNAIRVNGVDHKEVLERLVMPWIKSVSKERTYKKTLRRLIRPRRSKNGC